MKNLRRLPWLMMTVRFFSIQISEGNLTKAEKKSVRTYLDRFIDQHPAYQESQKLPMFIKEDVRLHDLLFGTRQDIRLTLEEINAIIAKVSKTPRGTGLSPLPPDGFQSSIELASDNYDLVQFAVKMIREEAAEVVAANTDSLPSSKPLAEAQALIQENLNTLRRSARCRSREQKSGAEKIKKLIVNIRELTLKFKKAVDNEAKERIGIAEVVALLKANSKVRSSGYFEPGPQVTITDILKVEALKRELGTALAVRDELFRLTGLNDPTRFTPEEAEDFKLLFSRTTGVILTYEKKQATQAIVEQPIPVSEVNKQSKKKSIPNKSQETDTKELENLELDTHAISELDEKKIPAVPRETTTFDTAKAESQTTDEKSVPGSITPTALSREISPPIQFKPTRTNETVRPPSDENRIFIPDGFESIEGPWNIIFHSEAKKGFQAIENRKEFAKQVSEFKRVYTDLKQLGRVSTKDYTNYGELGNTGMFHCHLTGSHKTVVMWRVLDSNSKKIQIYYLDKHPSKGRYHSLTAKAATESRSNFKVKIAQ